MEEKKVKKSKNHFDSNVPAWKQLFKVSMPILLLSISNVSYSFIDTLLSIILIDDPNYSASRILGLTFPIMMLSMSLVMIILSGLSLYLPKMLGKEKYEDGKDLIVHTFVYITFITLFVILILFFIAPLWMNWLGGLGDSPLTTEEINGGIIYIRITSLLLIFLVFRDVILRTIRTENKGLTASLIPMIALPVNLFFDWLFMGPMGYKLGGAAFASLIGAFVGFLIAYLYSIRLIKKDDTIINYQFKRFKWKSKYFKGLSFYGLNNYIRMVSLIIYSIAFTFFTIQLNGTSGSSENYWKEYITLSSRFIALGTVFAFSLIQASITLFAFNKGRKDYERAKKFLKLGMIYAFISTVILIIIMIPLVNPILNLFKIDDPNGNEIYRNAFYIRLLVLPLSLIQYIYVSFFAITKNLKYTILNSIIGNIIVGLTILSLFYYLIYLPTDNTNLFFLSLVVISLINLIIFTPIFYKKYKETLSST